MADDILTVPVRSPWRNTLLQSLKQVHHSLFMICPYIKDDVITAIKDALLAREVPSPFAMRVITRALPDDFLSNASDITALQHLLAWPNEFPDSSVEIRIINNVHAKVWLFDSHLAIVGSGNATSSGLERNLEYGLAVSDPSLVAHIHQDWQSCWEQATPTNAQELEQMRQWLESMIHNEELHQIEAEANEKRKNVERKVGVAPRIGKRLYFQAREKQIVSTKIAETASLYSTESIIPAVYPWLDETRISPSKLSNAIHVPSVHLWQAMGWAYPYSDNKQTGFLKLARLPISEGTSTLQCIWADGKRLSRATILGTASVGQEQASLSSWALTLDTNSISFLMLHLRHIDIELQEMLQIEHSRLAFSLEAYPRQHLCISYIHIPGKNVFCSINLPYTLTSIPGNYPILRSPTSHITVQSTFFKDAIKTLYEQWHAANPQEREVTAIELFFNTPGPNSALTLTIGHINAPLALSIPGKDSVISGPEVRLRLDIAALWQIVASASSKKAHSWHISTDRDFDIVHFDREPSILNDSALLWRHQLWNLPG